MHQAKHAVLDGLGYETKLAVMRAAARAGASVDEVVHAAHTRASTTEARAALAMITKEQRQALAQIDWSYECEACKSFVPKLLSCPTCKTKGCENCQVPDMPCPACRKSEAQRKAQLFEKDRAKLTPVETKPE